MSHWNFDDFYDLNDTRIANEYKVLTDDSASAFETYSKYTKGIGGEYGLSGLIAPMQSVLITSTGVFAANELKTDFTSMRQYPRNKLRSAQAETNWPVLKITASKGGKQNSSYVLFDETANNNYLLNEDSYKLFVASVTEPVAVYTRSTDGIALDINLFSDCAQMIPLGVRTSQTGTIDLQFEGIENFMPGYEVFLIDAENGNKKINLKKTPEYSFNKTTADLFMDGRLYLSLSQLITGISNPEQGTAVFSKSGQLQVISNSHIQEVQVVDTQGRIILNEANIDNFAYTHDLRINGIYVVKVLTNDGMVVRKITSNNF